ncbi:MAG: AMP-binding protein [Neomegalonema sp.]|nr:AMP-binding protein [Neomegalonema sp.]
MIGPFQGSYEEAYARFQWPAPARLNLADALCGEWAAREPERIALHCLGGDGLVEDWSYSRLDRRAAQLANTLIAHGLKREDRCAILLPQCAEAVIAHLALYKMAAIALPLFTLFGEDALRYRLENSGARMAITDAANLPKLLAIRDQLPDLERVYCIDGDEIGVTAFHASLDRASDQFEVVATTPDDPAFICYTSGTTGPAKGALHGHKVLMGHMPGVQMWLEGIPRRGDVTWTPADWAWMGGLCNVLMPSMATGIPVVAHRMGKFDPDHAYWIWQRFNVTVGFIPPTALKIMRSAKAPAPGSLSLRAIGCGGEALGPKLLEWGRETLGLTINEFYGQTECNLVTANNQAMMPVKPGSMGRATPGHRLAVLDSEGQILPAGTAGEIAVARGPASMFLGYWQRPDATAAKFSGEWMRTGDEGMIDEEGYVFFSARADDVITSAGYRIGPSEVEDCLTAHPSVLMAGVVGVPDDLRGEAVKAFVVLAPGAEGSEALVEALQAHVKARLSSHSYPRQVEFVRSLPLTATGKIMRRELRDA